MMIGESMLLVLVGFLFFYYILKGILILNKYKINKIIIRKCFKFFYYIR